MSLKAALDRDSTDGKGIGHNQEPRHDPEGFLTVTILMRQGIIPTDGSVFLYIDGNPLQIHDDLLGHIPTDTGPPSPFFA